MYVWHVQSVETVLYQYCTWSGVQIIRTDTGSRGSDRCQISDVESQMSDVRCQMSDVRCHADASIQCTLHVYDGAPIDGKNIVHCTCCIFHYLKFNSTVKCNVSL